MKVVCAGGCGRQIEVNAQSAPEPTCHGCRRAKREQAQSIRTPKPLKPCGTIAAYNRHIRRGETPDRACMDAHNAEAAKYAKRAPEFRDITCEHCGKPLPKGQSRFCDDECRRTAPRGACRIWPRNCAECATPYIARHPNAFTCSTVCSRKHRNRTNDYRRHKRSVRRSVTKDSDITPRQEGEMRRRARKCPLCGTFMTSKPGKPNSKELDHIVPIGMGGTHTHGNVRIICRLCNLRRPKDGSDYAGPVTLWATAPGVMIKPRPKALASR